MPKEGDFIMYSIVLIDDERWMLEQMWRILEWGSLDCKIAGEFTDAQKSSCRDCQAGA